MTVFSAFQILNMSFHCLLAYILSSEKSAADFIEDHIYWGTFLLLHMRFSFCYRFLTVNYSVSSRRYLWIYSPWVHWPWWMYRLMFPSNFEIFGHYCFKYSFYSICSLLFSGTPIMHRLICVLVSHNFLRLCLFFFIFFCPRTWYNLS